MLTFDADLRRPEGPREPDGSTGVVETGGPRGPAERGERQTRRDGGLNPLTNCSPGRPGQPQLTSTHAKNRGQAAGGGNPSQAAGVARTPSPYSVERDDLRDDLLVISEVVAAESARSGPIPAHKVRLASLRRRVGRRSWPAGKKSKALRVPGRPPQFARRCCLGAGPRLGSTTACPRSGTSGFPSPPTRSRAPGRCLRMRARPWSPSP